MQDDTHASGVNPYAIATPIAKPAVVREAPKPPAPPPVLPPEPASGDSFVLASRNARLRAHVIDSLLYGVCLIGILMAAFAGTLRTAGGVALVGVLAALALFVVNLVLLHRHGQSVGKRVVGIRIVRSDGSRCTLARIVALRMVIPVSISLIPIVGYVFGLLDPLAIFREDLRCIHDHLADTIVVDA